MDNSTPSQHHEESVSPSLPHIFTTIKTESGVDFWNPPLIHPVNGVITENSSTYTPLETVYPESSYAYTPYASCAFTNSTSSTQPLYSSYSNLSELQPCLYQRDRDPDLSLTARDEGIGSSPSSFDSSSPPLIPPSAAAQDIAIPSTSSSSNYDYINHPSSSRSSPENLAYSDLPASECGNCGSRSDVVWVNTHFLCRSCYLDRTRVALQQPVQETANERKRKRSPTMNKKNLVCSNCKAVSTSLWRRSSNNEVVCNACGLYEKLHKHPRPISMRKDTIQTRKRKPKESSKPKRNSTNRASASAPRVEAYAPNNPQQYSLPTYNTIHMRGVLTNTSNNHDAGMLPSISNSPPFYANYRPDMYMYPVSPNEVMNVPQSLPSPHGLSPSPHGYSTPSPQTYSTPHHHLAPSPPGFSTPPQHGLSPSPPGFSTPPQHGLSPSPPGFSTPPQHGLSPSPPGFSTPPHHGLSPSPPGFSTPPQHGLSPSPPGFSTPPQHGLSPSTHGYSTGQHDLSPPHGLSSSPP